MVSGRDSCSPRQRGLDPQRSHSLHIVVSFWHGFSDVDRHTSKQLVLRQAWGMHSFDNLPHFLNSCRYS